MVSGWHFQRKQFYDKKVQFFVQHWKLVISDKFDVKTRKSIAYFTIIGLCIILNTFFFSRDFWRECNWNCVNMLCTRQYPVRYSKIYNVIQNQQHAIIFVQTDYYPNNEDTEMVRRKSNNFIYLIVKMNNLWLLQQHLWTMWQIQCDPVHITIPFIQSRNKKFKVNIEIKTLQILCFWQFTITP